VRFVRHLIGGLLVLVVLAVGALAFALYDPLSHSPHRLRLDQLLTAAPGVGGLSVSGEPSVQRSDPPAIAALALRYQPNVIVSGYDRFWPVSVAAVLATRWNGHRPCLYINGRCQITDPSLASLAGKGSPNDYLHLPSPVDNVKDAFRSAAAALGVPAAILDRFPHDIAKIDPFTSAQEYFYYLPRTRPHAYPGLPAGLISLEYWFFYPLNYFPLARIPLEALSNPLGSTLGNTDYHQGDFEHVAVLLDPHTMQPRYLWMARHADEGVAYPWGSKSVQWSGDHATIYEALGSHSSYAHCGIQRRSRTYWFINDYVVCIPHRTFGFLASSTRLVDLAKTAWACWRGHFGDAGSHLKRGRVNFAPYETGGPLSPLTQQENFGSACHLAPGTPKPAAPL
jgi:hypothetical protein